MPCYIADESVQGLALRSWHCYNENTEQTEIYNYEKRHAHQQSYEYKHILQYLVDPYNKEWL